MNNLIIKNNNGKKYTVVFSGNREVILSENEYKLYINSIKKGAEFVEVREGLVLGKYFNLAISHEEIKKTEQQKIENENKKSLPPKWENKPILGTLQKNCPKCTRISNKKKNDPAYHCFNCNFTFS